MKNDHRKFESDSHHGGHLVVGVETDFVGEIFIVMMYKGQMFPYTSAIEGVADICDIADYLYQNTTDEDEVVKVMEFINDSTEQNIFNTQAEYSYPARANKQCAPQLPTR